MGNENCSPRNTGREGDIGTPVSVLNRLLEPETDACDLGALGGRE